MKEFAGLFFFFFLSFFSLTCDLTAKLRYLQPKFIFLPLGAKVVKPPAERICGRDAVLV